MNEGVFLFSVIASTIVLYMTAWYFVSLEFKRQDVADVAWGLGFVLAAWTAYALTSLDGAFNVRGILLNTLVTIWGLRLSIHIYARNRKKLEDKRYAVWRESWGKWFLLRSYFQGFLLQVFLLMVIVSPVLWVHANNSFPIGVIGIVGVVLWVVGFFFEAVGDWQLRRHLKNPVNSGLTLMTGLWKYTRHPNYFGEVMQWWGIWLCVIELPYGWVTIIGPLTITLLIFKVSGISLLERAMAGRADFESYKLRTSRFFPLPPKKFL